MIERQRKAQKYFLVRKVHLEPGAFRLMPAMLQRQLSSPWEASVRLVDTLSSLPDAALSWWADQPSGHLVLSAGEEGYRDYFTPTNREPLRSVAMIPIELTVTSPREALIRALFTMDHLLGCLGEDGLWLSDGGGVDQRWQRIAQQLQQLFSLGYGLTDAERSDAHLYFATGLADAMLSDPSLVRNDPKLSRLMRTSILSEGFWEGFLRNEARYTASR